MKRSEIRDGSTKRPRISPALHAGYDDQKPPTWIIDLGPEGGDGGGEIVAAGTPEAIVKEKRSYTGAFLKPVLERRDAGRRKKRIEAAE